MKRLILATAILATTYSPLARGDHPLARVNLSPIQIDCLARNIYFEARSESLEGQFAVAHVTMNRVRSHEYPNNICDVVKQNKQFSWYKGPESVIINWRDPIEVASFRSIMNVTIDFMHDYANGNLKDSTRGSMWYHRDDIKPDWTENLRKTAVFGRHIFYRK
jgi:spore germination cell wall hydrolase CwlJ-like protein